MFGGSTDKNGDFENRIARLDSKSFEWTRVGELSRGRCGHNVIEVQGQILVVGGNDLFKTERCNYSEGVMQCTEQQPELDYYNMYPELYAVSDYFCK